MKPHTLFKRQLILFIFSILHFFLGIVLYLETKYLLLAGLGFILVIINVGLLLHNFSMNIRYLLAVYAKKTRLITPFNLLIFIMGVLGFAMIIFLFFMMIFGLLNIVMAGIFL